MSYNEEVLENNASVRLCIYPDNRNFQVLCAISYEDSLEQLFMIFTYDVKKKTMSTEPLKAMSDTFAQQYPDKYDYYTYYDDPEYIEMFMEEHDITKEEIEAYRDYFLYDVLIGMWVDGNDEESRYDRNDAGHFVLKDELFANFE